MNLTKWTLDPQNSEMTFELKHLLITTISGRFNKFHVEAETEQENFFDAYRIVFMADIESLDSKNAIRDAHLRSDDFFQGTKYRRIWFMANDYSTVGLDAKLTGQLTIKNITRTTTFAVEFGGLSKNKEEQTTAEFIVRGVLSRKDFGLTWNVFPDSESVFLGDEIWFKADVRLVKVI